jgi:hypothetical protein
MTRERVWVPVRVGSEAMDIIGLDYLFLFLT